VVGSRSDLEPKNRTKVTGMWKTQRGLLKGERECVCVCGGGGGVGGGGRGLSEIWI
jgi:hypothetical protein